MQSQLHGLGELHARGEGIYTFIYLFTIHRLGSEGGAGTFQLCLVESIVLEAVLFIVLLVEAAVRLVAAHGSQVALQVHHRQSVKQRRVFGI